MHCFLSATEGKAVLAESSHSNTDEGTTVRAQTEDSLATHRRIETLVSDVTRDGYQCERFAPTRACVRKDDNLEPMCEKSLTVHRFNLATLRAMEGEPARAEQEDWSNDLKPNGKSLT